MTILDFVLSQKVMGINEWIKVIEDNGLAKYQHTIIECADEYNMITVNHSARFDKNCINL